MQTVDAFLSEFEVNFEPVSTWVIVQSAAAVISTIVGVVGAIDTDEDLDQINRKLDGILDNQIRILDEIRALKVFFLDHLRREFEVAINSNLQGCIDQFSVAAAGIRNPRRLNRHSKRRLNEALPGIERTTYDLLNYGPAVYQPGILGFAILSAVYDLLKFPQSEINASVTIFERRVGNWLVDQSNGIDPLLENAKNHVNLLREGIKGQLGNPRECWDAGHRTLCLDWQLSKDDVVQFRFEAWNGWVDAESAISIIDNQDYAWHGDENFRRTKQMVSLSQSFDDAKERVERISSISHSMLTALDWARSRRKVALEEGDEEGGNEL